MDVSVIIVNYNVKEFLRGALKSVFHALEAGGLKGEVFVVDNNSGDDSVQMVREEFPSVRLHALGYNPGFGKANNIALREARGEFLLLLNPDTIVAEDTLSKMIGFMREHPKAGMAGCKLLNGDGSFQLSCRRGFPTPWASFTKLFGLSTFFPKSRHFAQYHLTYLPVDKTYEVDAISGAFMFISWSAYEATNGFDEDYFMYGEDLDLCYRVKKAGFEVYYAPITATIHFKGESTKRSALNEVKVFYEAMHIFIKKNYGSSVLFASLLRFGIFLRSVLALLKKHRGALLVVILDLLAVVASILGISIMVFGDAFGLPDYDYPAALIVPPIVVTAIFALAKMYTPSNRRAISKIFLAVPASMMVLSSLTYFFKDFASSRSLMLGVTAAIFLSTIMMRYALRIVDRVRYGGENSASPVLRRTLIVGVDDEARRIAHALSGSRFMLRYDVLGFIDRGLTRVGEHLTQQHSIVGSVTALGKLVREMRATEVIFTSSALPYSEMLLVMQQVSDENPALLVNFNVVPTATDVVLGRNKIELLSNDNTSEVLGLIPLEYNIQRISHKIAKRSFDILLSALLFPLVGLYVLIARSENARRFWSQINSVLRGELSLVGVASEGRDKLSKSGLTSLAAITLKSPHTARPEDIAQLDLYYARHHTLGMDMEILFRSLFSGRFH